MYVHCAVCTQPTTDNTTNAIHCYGFCGKSFHFPCLAQDNPNYKDPLFGSLSKINNLHWYCEMCRQLSVNGIASGLINSAKIVADITPTFQPLLDQIKFFNAADQAKPTTSNPISTCSVPPTIPSPFSNIVWLKYRLVPPAPFSPRNNMSESSIITTADSASMLLISYEETHTHTVAVNL